MNYAITHKITIFAEADTDFDLFEQESFRIAEELGLDVDYMRANAASLPSVMAEGKTTESLTLFYRRLMAFFYA